MIRAILRGIVFAFVLTILVAGAFAGGFATSRLMFPPPLPADGGAPPEWKAPIAIFWEAWGYVHQDFFKTPLDDDALVYGTVSGMVEALGDPHTTFIDRKRAEIVRTNMQGSFERHRRDDHDARRPPHDYFDHQGLAR
jgi:Periplasmic protease